MGPDNGTLRRALRSDARVLARLAELASGGLAPYLWAQTARAGETACDVGTRRIEQGEGNLCWQDAVIDELGGAAAGGMIAYWLDPASTPVDELPPQMRPMQALKDRAVGSWHINILATFPGFRGRGVATRLLGEAARSGGGIHGLSLIVADRNLPALRLYEGFGFSEAGREAMVKEGWTSPSKDWVLMLKPPA